MDSKERKKERKKESASNSHVDGHILSNLMADRHRCAFSGNAYFNLSRLHWQGCTVFLIPGAATADSNDQQLTALTVRDALWIRTRNGRPIMLLL